MPSNRQKSYKNVSRTNRANPPSTSLSSAVVKRIPMGTLSNDAITARLTAFTSFSSGAGGALTAEVQSNPNSYLGGASDLTEWDTYAALYQQYRVLTLTVRFVPRRHNWISGDSVGVTSPSIVTYSRRGGTQPTTYQSCLEQSSSRLLNSDVPFETSINFNTDNLWEQVNVPVARQYVGVYGENFPSSTVIYDAMVEMTIQFRARQGS